jgi:hypothetical protein
MPFENYEQNESALHTERAEMLIRVRAYLLWNQAGRPHGMRTPNESWQDHFWHKAKSQMINEEKLDETLIGESIPLNERSQYERTGCS